ncbi:formyltetrahydrofolate deformylase [Nocardioides humi]|uniref:Formyltetrahydrofolate deformylase n=1 Tax=Nocardioides humi TaxID=449461 RepID=A0ABN2BR64_9ACTN|nr:formyltetrahydrofolate deformylase [Nocardioides humi]
MTDAKVVLTLTCPDQPGIVYAVSRFLHESGCSIVESQQFLDRQSGNFFMRVELEVLDDAVSAESLREGFATVRRAYSMEDQFLDAARRQRVLVMASTAGHCLNDLLFRTFNGGLDVEISAVVSNHDELRYLADTYGVPYHHIPVDAQTKVQAERELLDLVVDLDVDLVVLARYMQVLSGDLCKALEGRVINIHHSMLPSFKGARPYDQAHARGVKLIGATAHYVTADLDEGPIIEQEVARVDHGMTAAQVRTLGRDVECLALSRAVRWHTENRVLLDGSRTVVFP